MKILVAPDKFKGSLTALEVCNAVQKGILNVLPKAEIIKLPLADGGEGSLEALESSIKFERIYSTVNNPLYKPIKTWYGIKGDTAYIEMAKASGLQLLSSGERNPKLTTSLGTGELIVDAINHGARKIYLFIGGSATNDAAIGIAFALGYKFYDSENKELKPIGGSLLNIRTIEFFPKVSLENVDITVLTDVQNPLYGDNGAAFVYAAQKGADNASIQELDEGLKNIANLAKLKFGKDISNIAGSGAAGGIGGGMIAFCNAELKSGIEVVFELLNFDTILKQCDLVITGEGKLDKQTLEGKVVKGVIDKSNRLNKTIGIVCGVSTLSKFDLHELHDRVKSTKVISISFEDSMKNAEKYLISITESLISDMMKQT